MLTKENFDRIVPSPCTFQEALAHVDSILVLAAKARIEPYDKPYTVSFTWQLSDDVADQVVSELKRNGYSATSARNRLKTDFVKINVDL